jgi:hypothetical protein
VLIGQDLAKRYSIPAMALALLNLRGNPSHFQSARPYREDWICAVARGSRFCGRLSLKQYLAASHIVVSTYAGVQTIPDKQLAAVGAKRSSQSISPELVSGWPPIARQIGNRFRVRFMAVLDLRSESLPQPCVELKRRPVKGIVKIPVV